MTDANVCVVCDRPLDDSVCNIAGCAARLAGVPHHMGCPPGPLLTRLREEMDDPTLGWDDYVAHMQEEYDD